jgi:hypothetical protein
MRRDDLQIAVEEARRFLARAELLLSADRDPAYPWLYGEQAASVKRASMDLTKALPNHRRNR